jgi:ABC-type multidrug transport system fused ATPase/permease subunit
MAVGGIRASRRIHRKLCDAMLRASYHILSETPRGRILSRFADDISVVDLVMPFSVRSMMNTILHTAASIFIIAYATPFFLVCVPPMAILYLFIQVHCGFSVFQTV